MRPEDQYVQAIINRHRATPKHFPQLERVIQAWAGNNLESIALSGSYAKETALKDSDVDLFLSLKPQTQGPLSEIQSSLANHFRYYQPECRNVSVRIRFEGTAIDLVPGRRREGSSQHTLWQSRQDTWRQTDIAEQIQHVRESGLTNEILALKIWTRQHALRFPSFTLELAVIQALKPSPQISNQFLSILRYLSEQFPKARLYDPANTNNELTANLNQEQKHQIAKAARGALTTPTWPEILGVSTG
jgi:predicted nucleotidyltransferase